MLSFFARRVALSAYRPNAVYSRVLPSAAPALRSRGIPDASLHTHNARTPTNPRRNASTKAAATAKKTEPSTKPRTADGGGPVKLTPEQREAQRQRIRAENQLAKKKEAERAVALRAKRKAQAEKKKELAALKRKRLAEKRKKLAEAKEKERRERKQRNATIKPPGRRMSGFALYVKETKKPLLEAAAIWQNLSDAAKEEYAARARVVAEKRKEEFDAFMKTISRSDIVHLNRVRRSKGKNRIRVKASPRPLTNFMAYLKEFRTRPEQAGKPALEVARAAGEAWRSLTQEERDYYKPKPTESSTV